jgi:ketosteroid isomerase-like protein
MIRFHALVAGAAWLLMAGCAQPSFDAAAEGAKLAQRDALESTHGRSVTVWRRDGDGEWRCVVDISNDAPPA